MKDEIKEEIKLILESNSSMKGDCLEWNARLNASGYGYFYFLKKNWLVHRASYDLNVGIVNENSYICHKCNNRKCLNHSHLYEGTPQSNAIDLKNAPYYQDYRNKILDENKNEKSLDNYEKSFDFIGFMTIPEFATIFRLHANTVLNNIKKGLIQAVKFGQSQRYSYRIPISEIYRLNEESYTDKIKDKLHHVYRLNIEKSLIDKILRYEMIVNHSDDPQGDFLKNLVGDEALDREVERRKQLQKQENLPLRRIMK